MNRVVRIPLLSSLHFFPVQFSFFSFHSFLDFERDLTKMQRWKKQKKNVFRFFSFLWCAFKLTFNQSSDRLGILEEIKRKKNFILDENKNNNGSKMADSFCIEEKKKKPFPIEKSDGIYMVRREDHPT